MPKTILLPVIALLAAPGFAMEDRSVSDLVVESVSDLPPPSGWIRSWVKVSTTGGDIYFVPYGRKGQKLPSVGEVCAFSYYLQDIDGFVGTTLVVGVRDAKIVHEFNCKVK